MTKIKKLIEDFKLNQEILGREKRYVDLCVFRLYRWEEFTVKLMKSMDEFTKNNYLLRRHILE